MKYFKDIKGEVFAFAADGSDDAWISENRPDLVPMTQEEVEAHLEDVAPKPVFPKFRGNEKLDLFTYSEQLAIVTATMTDPIVKLIYDRLIGASYWSYEDPETEQGLQLLLAKGLITSERKQTITLAMQPK